MFELTDKVAIVTGASRGIGKSIAVEFARAGANIVATARNEKEIKDTAEEARKFGKKALAIPTDVRDKQQVERMVQTVMDEFQRIDILVNDAGIYPPHPFLKILEEEWDDIMNTNLKSAFLCTQACARIMAEQNKGNIINIGSISGLQPAPGQVDYGASKAAMMHMTQSLSVELAPYHIRVNTLAPGGISTEGGQAFYYSLTPEARIQHRHGIPARRYGVPEEIATGAIYLASDESDYVTGHTLVINGGGLPLIVPTGGFAVTE